MYFMYLDVLYTLYVYNHTNLIDPTINDQLAPKIMEIQVQIVSDKIT